MGISLSRTREIEKNLRIRLAIMYCVVYNTHMSAFGNYVRTKRLQLHENDTQFSLRKVAAAIDVEPSYLSKIERGEQPPPGEQTIIALAKKLGEDADMLLALAGKVSDELQAIIRKRPALFAQLIRDLKNLPDHAVLRLVREVRDGKW
jgi:HTH-type transcriptional regulator, competence development regulator